VREKLRVVATALVVMDLMWLVASLNVATLCSDPASLKK